MTSLVARSAFNSPLETGIRSLTILVSAHPEHFDLQRLVEMDYLVVHSKDADGPESLHAPLPLRAGELLVRRTIIEAGLMLMISRGLVKRYASPNGINYGAAETAAAFLSSLTESYTRELVIRANWAAARFRGIATAQISQITHQFFERSSQFLSLTDNRGAS